MPIKRPPLINGGIYHIILRAVEGTKLFRDNKDYLRMIHDLFEFNDDDPVEWNFRRNYNSPRTVLERIETHKKRKMLVEILAFCLMPNHIHLLVRQVKDGGISKFMRKLGAGYGIYYNNKYKRKGHIFQGKFKVVQINTNDQLKVIFVYIHTNPVAILVPHWKERGIRDKDLKKIIKFLENYKWSSYPDYLDKENFPSLTSREFLLKVMKSKKDCQKFVNNWLKHKQKLADFKYITIE